MASDLSPDPVRGVFTTTRVLDGEPVALGAHLARLAASVRELYGAALPADAAALARERAAGVARGRLRLVATPRDGADPQVEATVAPLDPGAAAPLALRALPAAGWPGAHKWVDRRLLDALEAQAAPAAPLLLGADGSVRETARANVFALGADGVLRTPPADGAILPGVTRAQVLALVAEAGVAVREERLTLDDLHAARAVFTTNAIRGIEPVAALDGRPLGADRALTAQLARALASAATAAASPAPRAVRGAGGRA